MSLSSLCPQGMQAYPLCHCSNCISIWADLAFNILYAIAAAATLAFNVACLFSNYFLDYFPFFPCIHHSYCHVMCQIPCTCYQLVVMAHNVMLSVPSLAAGCQGVLRGETPQLEYGHDQEKEVVKDHQRLRIGFISSTWRAELRGKGSSNMFTPQAEVCVHGNMNIPPQAHGH